MNTPERSQSRSNDLEGYEVAYIGDNGMEEKKGGKGVRSAFLFQRKLPVIPRPFPENPEGTDRCLYPAIQTQI